MPQRMVRMPLSNTENQKAGDTVTTARPAREVRFAFTPYYQEKHHYLERCIASVKRQTIPAGHIVVADGFPQDWIDQTSVRHLRLDRVHQDHGNTPRAIGGLIAIAEGYEGIGLLDADCWLEPDHLEHCLEQAKQVGLERCGFVAAARTLRRLDKSIMSPMSLRPSMLILAVSCSCLHRSRRCRSGL